MKKDSMVLVYWNDSNFTHGWRTDDGSLEDAAHCRTVGIMKAEDERNIEIALGDSACGSKMETITIPKSCITLIRKLRVR